MLLAIDIGNSTIKYGFFEAGKIVDRFSVQTRRDYSADELEFDRLRKIKGRFGKASVERVIAASVVPELREAVTKSILELYQLTPYFVDSDWDFGIAIRYTPRSTVGADRLVNAAAAAAIYGTPIITCSFGTATTIDVVDGEGVFRGGVIAPGIATGARALSTSTSLLPCVDPQMPEKAIGESTPQAMLSGIVLGHIAMVEGMISRINRELRAQAPVVATGGFCRLIAKNSPAIDFLRENLTLEGLHMLSDRLRPQD